MPDLVLLSPGEPDRFPFEVRVTEDAGGWTPGPYVGIDAGNQIELTEAELRWLVEEAGPAALKRLDELQDGGRHDAAAASPPAAAASIADESPLRGAGSSAAGQGKPSDPSPGRPQSNPETGEA